MGGDSQTPLVDLAVDAWKFARTMHRSVLRLAEPDQSRAATQVRFFARRIEAVLAGHSLSLVSLEGLPYEAGMAASPVNLDEFVPGQQLIVDQMLEPVVMGPTGVVRTGTFTLRSA